MAKKKRVAKRSGGSKTRARTRPARGWTANEVTMLKRLFPNKPTAELAAKLGRKTDAVKKKASRMGLRKSKRYLKSLGRA